MALPKGMAKLTAELEPAHRFEWIETLKGKGITDELTPETVKEGEDPFALGSDTL